jgi:transcriptional regulator with XRE-family HTH domain
MQNKDLRAQLRARLKNLREIHCLTQEKLAQKAGISLYYLQLMEGSKPKNPTLLILEKLAGVFDMEVWEFLKF